MAFGSFWMTPERLEMTQFTRPISVDKIMLWIKKPSSKNSLKDGMLQCVAPFSNGIWLTLAGALLLLVVLNIVFSTRNTRPLWFKVKKESNDKPLWERLLLIGWIFFDSFVHEATFTFGEAVDYDIEFSMAQKVLNMGYAVLVLFVVAVYTANLTSFLTIQNAQEYVSTIEGAIMNRSPICIHPVLYKDMINTWPDSLSLIKISNGIDEDAITEDMMNSLDSGECEVVAHAPRIVLSKAPVMEKFCDRELVLTNSLVLEKYIGLPINERYAQSMSYFISLGENEKENKISYDDYTEDNFPPAKCDFNFEAIGGIEDDTMSLSLKHIILPILIFLFSVILSLLIHVTRVQHKSIRRRSPLKKSISKELENRMNKLNEDFQDDHESFKHRKNKQSVDLCENSLSLYQNDIVTINEIEEKNKSPKGVVESLENKIETLKELQSSLNLQHVRQQELFESITTEIGFKGKKNSCDIES